VNVYQLIAVVSAALAVLAGAWDASRLRRNHQYSAAGLAISTGGPILSLIVYLLVTNLALKQIVSVGLLALGGAAGVYVARRATLSETDETGRVRMTGASWLPLPAALSVGAIQICGAIDSLAGMILALAALEVSVAFGVAAATTLMYRRSATSPTPVEPHPPQPQAAAG
jgi:hypothetical protein